MAKLSDLEEALHEVKNRMLIPNLREAISCYYASSYRACIILSFNSLVDDLVEKLRVMKDVNNDAKRIYKNISELINKQTSFENSLIEQLIKANIFSELDGEIYKMFQKLRHKSAHPSGFAPSAECARFIFIEIINRFLSKASLQTTARIDKLISDISEGNFFTDSSIENAAKIVKSEISNIHPDAYPQLINRAYKKYIEHDSKANNPYLTFIGSLARIDDSRINKLLVEYVVKANISKLEHEHIFISMLTSNPEMFSEIDRICAMRIIKNIKKSLNSVPKTLSNSALRNPFYAILKTCNKGSGEIHSLISDMMDVFITHKDKICYFMKHIDKSSAGNGKVAYLNLYKLILKEIDSRDSARVDEMCKIIIDDESSSFKDLHDSRALEIIIKLLFNSSGSKVIGDLINNKFDEFSYLKDKAENYFRLEGFLATTLGKKLKPKEIVKVEEIFS